MRNTGEKQSSSQATTHLIFWQLTWGKQDKVVQDKKSISLTPWLALKIFWSTDYKQVKTRLGISFNSETQTVWLVFFWKRWIGYSDSLFGCILSLLNFLHHTVREEFKGWVEALAKWNNPKPRIRGSSEDNDWEFCNKIQITSKYSKWKINPIRNMKIHNLPKKIGGVSCCSHWEPWWYFHIQRSLCSHNHGSNFRPSVRKTSCFMAEPHQRLWDPDS